MVPYVRSGVTRLEKLYPRQFHALLPLMWVPSTELVWARYFVGSPRRHAAYAVLLFLLLVIFGPLVGRLQTHRDNVHSIIALAEHPSSPLMPLMPIDPGDIGADRAHFAAPLAKEGAWRATGILPSREGTKLLVLSATATSAVSAPDRMRQVGVLPLLDVGLRRELLDLMSRRDFEWTNRRHQRYPTTDQELFRFPRLDAQVSDALQARLMPGLSALFGVDRSLLSIQDQFLIKYEHGPGKQAALPTHVDGSCFSYLVQLNRLEDFEGGGTLFAHASKPISVPAGDAMLFTGRFRHAGANITGGVRYLLAGFVGLHAPANVLRVVNARLTLRGGKPCGRRDRAMMGSHYNYQQLARFANALSGADLVRQLASGRVQPPHSWLHGNAQHLQRWCDRWLRANESGSTDPHTAHDMHSQMPLEVHAFLHHAVGWPLATKLRDQPPRRVHVRDAAARAEEQERQPALLKLASRGLRSWMPGPDR